MEHPTSKEPRVARQCALRSQENWHNALAKVDCDSVHEFQLLSDAHFTGQLTDGLGPYAFINAISSASSPASIHAPIVLRMANHLSETLPDFSESDDTFYHGGDLVDEIAALTSLSLGVRIRSGGETRRFDGDDDRYGRPIGWLERPRPQLILRRGTWILPSARGTRSINDLILLQSIPTIAPKRFVNLVRAARLYQDALWVAESEPNLAWVMFVSAVEVAAEDAAGSDIEASERLRDLRPEIADQLLAAGGETLLIAVAEVFAHTLSATKKFIDFVIEFLPEAPAARPEFDWLQLKWTKRNIKEVLNKIYAFRSSALHGGIPFPAPMLDPPHFNSSHPTPSEIPLLGMAASALGGTWLQGDAPITLNCFHYIVREALLKWWRSSLCDRS